MDKCKKKRQSGSLQWLTKRSKGKEYKVWRWRTYRRGDLGWERIDTELGSDLHGLRTRLYIAIGRLSAPLLMERWARWHFKEWDSLLREPTVTQLLLDWIDPSITRVERDRMVACTWA